MKGGASEDSGKHGGSYFSSAAVAGPTALGGRLFHRPRDGEYQRRHGDSEPEVCENQHPDSRELRDLASELGQLDANAGQVHENPVGFGLQRADAPFKVGHASIMAAAA